MGHLVMKKPVGDFLKGTISFWFRLPQSSIDACRAAHAPGLIFSPYWDVIPLVSWGPQKRFVQNAESGDEGPMAPSYIGVYVGQPDFPRDPPVLMVNLQTVDIGTSSLYTYSFPESFGNVNIVVFGDTKPNGGFPDILVDHWNHVILSWDLTPGCSLSGGNVVGSSKMWCSINDVNKSGDAGLPAITNSDFGSGANDHISFPAGLGTMSFVGESSSSVAVTDMESDPFCIPGPHPVEEYAGTRSAILKVEMAELQVFTGSTLDTDIVGNRRAFVDKNGVPVPPFGSVNDEGKRTPAPAEAKLGKRPEILISGSGSWIKGKNMGTLGVNYNVDPPKTIQSGQFKPTGNIKSWRPGPTLHGPQKPPPPSAPPPAVRLANVLAEP